MTKDELVARIKSERARLDEAIARAGERAEEPALEGGRSMKDVIAHISAWEKIGMALVRNNQPVPPQTGATGQSSTDAINDKVFADNRDRPYADVLADAQRSYGDLVAMVEGMSEGALDSRLGAGQAGAEQSPRAGEIISGNSDGHYREHAEQIERWLDSAVR
jgi:hypothetical protein